MEASTDRQGGEGTQTVETAGEAAVNAWVNVDMTTQDKLNLRSG